MVFEVRDLWPELPIAIRALKSPILIWLAKLLEKFAYSNSSMIVALSDGMKDGIVSTGFSAEKVEVIPNSCDLDLFSVGAFDDESYNFRFINNIPANNKLIVYAGTFGQINGVDYLVRLAYFFKKDNDVTFLAIGEGKELNRIKDLAIELDVLDKNFILHKSVTKKEMATVLSAADISISLFIPLKEMESNSANKFFDSLAAGTPVMVNYGGWQPELLIEYDAGFQLDRDLKKASKKLRKILSSPEKIVEYGKNARKLGELKFSRDKLAKQLEKVFQKALGKY